MTIIRGSLAVTLAMGMLAATHGHTAPIAGTGRPARSTGVYTLPSRTCGPFFLIPLNMPGKTGDERGQLTFLFDTGASITMVDPDSFARLTGRKVKAGERVDLIDAHAGPLTFRRLAASTRHMDHLTEALGESFDGILGYTAFRDFLLTVDYPNKRIRLSRGTLPPPDGREIFNASGPGNRPYLTLSAGGRSHRVLIDTGSPSTFALQNRKGMHWRTPPVAVRAFMSAHRLEMRKAGRLREELRIGQHRIKDPLVYLTANATELMGGAALRHFTVSFDQKYRRVRLRRTNQGPVEIPSLSDTGATLRRRADGLQVVTVLKGTPAHEAGLRAGDLIVTANGQNALKQSCPGASNASHESEITYEVKRGRELVTLTVHRAVLVE